MQADWKTTYEKTSYRDLPWFSPRPYPWMVRAVTEGWIPAGGRVLDVGCGAGTNLLYFARSGFRASGIDLAPGAIGASERRARRQHLSVELRVGDALRLPWKDRTFHAVTDTGCFHTLPISLRARYAREVARVLRPAGQLLISWVAREYTQAQGPPHRPSVGEMADTFESQFLFLLVEHRPAGRSWLPAYSGRFQKRGTPQPRRR